MTNDKYKVNRFYGFHDGLVGSFDEMRDGYEKAVDKAENIYIAHGQDAVDAAREDIDRSTSREAAEDVIRMGMQEDSE